MCAIMWFKIILTNDVYRHVWFTGLFEKNNHRQKTNTRICVNKVRRKCTLWSVWIQILLHQHLFIRVSWRPPPCDQTFQCFVCKPGGRETGPTSCLASRRSWLDRHLVQLSSQTVGQKFCTINSSVLYWHNKIICSLRHQEQGSCFWIPHSWGFTSILFLLVRGCFCRSSLYVFVFIWFDHRSSSSFAVCLLFLCHS